MSLRRLLMWLVFLCTGPLVILAIFLVVLNITDKLADRDIKGVNLLNSFATVIDDNLSARISGLNMLAESSLMDDPSSWKDLYREAHGYYKGFGSHVILADMEMHMLFNTRVPFGSKLPMLPRPKGHSAVSTVLATGKPAVGDIFFGPIAKEPLVAIAVPVKRKDKTVFFMLTIFETRKYQEKIDQVLISPRWSLALLDGNGKPIVRRTPRGNMDNSKQFIVKSKLSPWSVVLGMPRNIYSKTLINSLTAMAITVFSIILVSLFGAILVSRRLGKAITSLTATPAPGAPPPDITEIASVRRLLDESADKRRQFEAALRESEEKYQLIADNAHDWVYWIAPDRNLVYISPSCERMTGYSTAEFINHPQLIEEIVHPEDKMVLADHSEEIREENQPESVEYRIITKTGEVRWISHSCSPIYTGKGQYAGRRATNSNITDRKRAEENIRELNLTLEQRVLDRTAQLEAVNQELEAFSYSVSHDLRAPLRHIGGYVDLLTKECSDSLPGKGKHYLDTIVDSARQMGMLIDDLLQFSRTGRQELRCADLDMNNVLQEALEAIKQDTKNAIEWIIATLPHVFGDHALLRLVWVNLLSNAVKFTRMRETARIEIGVNEDGEEFIFFVRDNGVGFDMQYAHKLFGVFQRLHSTADFEGTGIGLANVRRIILRHGGRAWAEAEPDKGATIYFTLPGR